MKSEMRLKYVEDYLLQKYQKGVTFKTLERELKNKGYSEKLIKILLRLLEIKIKHN
jgi:hypothetical protein